MIVTARHYLSQWGFLCHLVSLLSWVAADYRRAGRQAADAGEAATSTANRRGQSTLKGLYSSPAALGLAYL